jgi:hypothetical protein
MATLAANVAHGLGHGVIGAAFGAWPAVALVGSYELLMMIIRSEQGPAVTPGTREGGLTADPLGEQAAVVFAAELALIVFPRCAPSVQRSNARLRPGGREASQRRDRAPRRIPAYVLFRRPGRQRARIPRGRTRRGQQRLTPAGTITAADRRPPTSKRASTKSTATHLHTNLPQVRSSDDQAYAALMLDITVSFLLREAAPSRKLPQCWTVPVCYCSEHEGI